MSGHHPPQFAVSLYKICGVFTLIIGLWSSPVPAQVVTYPVTPGMNLSGDYSVTVGGKSIPVYRGEGPLPYSFAYFDFLISASVQVISIAQGLSNVMVLPASKGVIPSINNNVMTFILDRSPTHLSIEPNGKNGPLLLFANPIEVNPPTPSTPGVVYYGPGLHKPNMIYLGSNQTLYIAGGAVIQAGVYVSGDNITIRGRGMLDGLPWAVGYGPQPTGGNRGQILTDNATNLNIEGVILKDAWYTAVGLNRSDYINVQNLKIVANRHDTAPPPGGFPMINEGMAPDGFHSFNTSHVLISDSFIRTNDDCIAPIVSWVPTPLTDGLTVTRTSLWTDRANIWRIGSGFQGLGVPSPSMRNMLFTDIDVLHYDPNWNPAIRLMSNKDQALENVRFENIRINHEGQAALVEVKPWTNTRAPIRNVYFKDISVTGNLKEAYGNVIVNGPDPSSSVTGVTFDNFIRHGQLTLKSSPGVSVEGHTSKIVFIGGATTTTTGLPDVIVTELLYANKNFTATVKNRGSAATPAGVVIGVSWSVDGQYKTGAYASGPLAAGASVTINSGSYMIPAGIHTVIAYADDVNRFRESNDTNNQLSKTITVWTTTTPAPTVSRSREES